VDVDVDEPKQAHKVGLAIDVANEAAKIGPFFGWIRDGTPNEKEMHVHIEAGKEGKFLNGDVSITYVGMTKIVLPKNKTEMVPQVKISGGFTGVLSGVTKLDAIVPASAK
jgi:hypothetical protein